MALTERYVTSDSVDTTWADSTNPLTPVTLSTAFSNATAGDRVNIKAGLYTRTGNDGVTFDGTLSGGPVVFRGYRDTPGDLDPGGTYAITRCTANGQLTSGLASESVHFDHMPIIAYNSGFRLAVTGCDYSMWCNLRITGIYSGYLFSTGAHAKLFQCSIQNASTNSLAMAYQVAGSGTCCINCDFDLSGGSGSTLATVDSSFANTTIIGCLVINSPSIGIKIASGNAVIIGTVIDTPTGHGISYSSGTATAAPPVIYGCTIYKSSATGISLGVAATGYAYSYAVVAVNNNITDCLDAVKSLNTGATPDIPGIFAYNRKRNNDYDVTGFVNWFEASDWRAITSTSEDPSIDFVDAPGGDFRLVSTAAAKGTGIPAYADIGALQRQEPNNSYLILQQQR